MQKNCFNFYNTFNSICEASNIDGVYGAFYRKALTISQIDDIIDDLSNALKMLNIFTDTISRYKIEPNTTEVDNLYIWKYGENDNKDKDYKYAKCKNYISIIEIIKYLRKTHGVYARNFANSKYIFLTCDWKLYRYNKSGRNPKVRYAYYNGFNQIIFPYQWIFAILTAPN